MIFRPLAPAAPELSRAELRRGALTSAIVLRDCALRFTASVEERKACRTLMRDAAFHWRHGTPLHTWGPSIA
jgi:hypothetical protein